jgi:hypothetical protein
VIPGRIRAAGIRVAHQRGYAARSRVLMARRRRLTTFRLGMIGKSA